eukprot:scaffold8853_cov103-Isochrysis_galbana.AAC.5
MRSYLKLRATSRYPLTACSLSLGCARFNIKACLASHPTLTRHTQAAAPAASLAHDPRNGDRAAPLHPIRALRQRLIQGIQQLA